MSDLRIPHFLRVTQALAFVSGFGLPVVVGCGGATFTPSTGAGSDASGLEGSSEYDGEPLGVAPVPSGGGVSVPYDGSSHGASDSPYDPYDGAVTGVVPYDGAVTGIVYPYDGAVTGVLPYDGGPTGVKVYDGGPLGIGIPLDGGHIVVGGPLPPPELPA
jgi:hypothetical protein